MSNPSERIARYAYRFWKRAGMTEWPTVRQVARSLGVRQRTISDYGGVDYEVTSYEYADDDDGGYAIGDQFVESLIDEVEVDWCKYWLSWSRRCVCGKHLIVRELPV